MSASLLVIVGATATGKSDLALAVAQRRGGEVINADSRQTIRGLTVATAVPGAAAMATVPHHLYGIRDIEEPFTAFDWLQLAAPLVAELAVRKRLAIVVGGTGLYVSALIDGLDPLPPGDPQQREHRNAQAALPGGLAKLAAELLQRAPLAAEHIDTKNPRRVIRALEILDAGYSLDEARTAAQEPRFPPRPGVVLVGLSVPSALHQQAITARTAAMLSRGELLAEVASALDAGTAPEALAAAGIGYAEALQLLDGSLTEAQAAAAINLRTRQYAKAQRTYFRRDPRIGWLDGTEPPDQLLDKCVDLLGA